MLRFTLTVLATVLVTAAPVSGQDPVYRTRFPGHTFVLGRLA